MNIPDRLGTRVATLKALKLLKGKCGDTSVETLVSMAIELIDVMPIDKLSRWLGYAQAHAVTWGHFTTTELRDLTRDDFHCGYVYDGLPVPPVVDIETFSAQTSKPITFTELLEFAKLDGNDTPTVQDVMEYTKGTSNPEQVAEMIDTLFNQYV